MKCKLIIAVISLLGLIIVGTNAQIDRICATHKFFGQCEQMKRGNPMVECVHVQDSIECAARMRNNTADFGVFSAEATMHLARLGWDGITVIKELRHRERAQEIVDFESVVLVKRPFESNGLGNLRGLNFCHPGFHYGKPEKWSERFLKHFERITVAPNCNMSTSSPAEIEVASLSQFFGSACRPGVWSHNAYEDAMLRTKYPNLCSLCDNPETCTYSSTLPESSHEQALDCLSRQGHVAYVARQEAQQFFTNSPDLQTEYLYLCPNGSTQAVEAGVRPCVWLRQPWGTVIASNAHSISLSQSLNMWLEGSGTWESALREIVTGDNFLIRNVLVLQAPAAHVAVFRALPIENDLCSTGASWCTTSPEELSKCEVIRSAGITSGVYPLIECKPPTTSTLACLKDISGSVADFMGIDSNFGYLARNVYNLTAALYSETESDKHSWVVVLVKADSSIERFENLRNKKACFPEFGGIASIAFINTGKDRGIFKKSECDYTKLLANFFGDSCAPGSRDQLHDPFGKTPQSLCNLCKESVVPHDVVPASDTYEYDEADLKSFDDDGVDIRPASNDEPSVNVEVTRNVNCAASHTNQFYGTRGALSCLNQYGDVAVVERQNLEAHAQTLNLNPHDFRVLCRNGTLAAYTGFAVDKECALTTIVDGEIVVRRGSSKMLGVVSALLSLDKYLNVDPDFKMYNIYDGRKDVLFQDATIGLVSLNETNLGSSVVNYIQLFQNVDACVDGSAASFTINIFMTLCFVLFTQMLRN